MTIAMIMTLKIMEIADEEDDNNVGRISQDSIEKAALEIGQNPEVNGIFISCTNLRFVKRVEALEMENQILMPEDKAK